MPFTQTDVDNLKAAIADGRGARSMTFSDQSVTFHSVDDMIKLLSLMQTDVGVTATTPKNYRLAITRKGT